MANINGDWGPQKLTYDEQRRADAILAATQAARELTAALALAEAVGLDVEVVVERHLPSGAPAQQVVVYIVPEHEAEIIPLPQAN